jgi:molybdenum cofactor guanylyltransferase
VNGGRLAAIVLAGGASSRMGAAKALLDWHGGPLVGRVAAIAGRVADPVVVVHAAGQELPPLTAAETVTDRSPDRGPLEGMAAGLRAVAGRAEAAFVTGTDLPFLHPAFVISLAAHLGDHDAAVPVAGGRTHQLCAVYRTAVLPALEGLLAEDRLRAALLLDELDAVRVPAQQLEHAESLRNLNTADEYREALAEPQPVVTIDGTTMHAATLGAAFPAVPAAGVLLNGRVVLEPGTPLVEGDRLSPADG